MTIYEEDFRNAQDVDYEVIRERSCRKGKDQNKRDTIKIKKSVFKKTVAVSVAVLLGAGALGGSFIDDKIENFSAEKELHGNIREFHTEWVAPNTHRTDDGQNYWYDVDKISEHINSTNNPDEIIYYCYQDMGKKTAGEIVELNGYNNFEGYVADKGFDDIDDYEDAMRDKLITKYRLEKENEELNDMVKDSNLQIMDDANNVKGAK